MQETIKTYEVKVGGANSVKELKMEISYLRDKLVQLDADSEEYAGTVNRLIEDERKLRQVMSATKESIEGASGSYNALVNEMGALKKVWREVTDEASRNEIGARISEINNQLKAMDSSIGNHQRNVGNYEEAITKAFMTPQQELKKLKTELAGMEEGTEVYNKTFQRMAELTHNVAEQQEMLKWSSADLGDIMGNLAGAAQSVAGGFSALNAIQGLIGSGNEEVEEAMLTTQRWIQLIQGLGALEEIGDRFKGLWEGIKNYSKGMNEANTSTQKGTNMLSNFIPVIADTNKLMNSSSKISRLFGKSLAFVGTAVKGLAGAVKAAISATGIGALIMLLTTGVSYLWDWVSGSKAAEANTKKFSESIDKLNEVLESNNKLWERRLGYLKAIGASEKQILDENIARLEEDKKKIQEQINEIENLKHSVENDWNFIDDWEDDDYADLRDKLDTLKKQLKDIDDAIEDAQIDFNNNKLSEITEENKKNLEESKKLYDTVKDYFKSDLQKLKEAYIKEFELINKLDVSAEEKSEAKRLLTLKYYKERDKILNESAKKQKELTDTANKKALEQEKEYWDLIRKLRQKEMSLYDNDEEEYYNKRIEEAQRFVKAVKDAMGDINSGVDSKKVLDKFNLEEGTDIKSLEDLSLELKVAEKNVLDFQDALAQFKSNGLMDSLSKEASKLGTALQQDLDEHSLNTELYASDQKPLERGGLSQDEIKNEMETRYGIQQQYIDAEIQLWQDALDSKLLIGEQEVEATNRLNDLIVQKQMLTTQQMIESNDLRVENFKNMVDSMTGIADSLGSIFGSLSNIIMGNAEAQLEAGKISQEEYEKEFERAKKFQIAEAIINTISGAVGAFTGIMKSTGGWGIALAVAQMAAVLATGYAQIEQIKNTKPNSSSSSSSSGTKYAMATPSATADYSPQLTQNATGQQETESLANALSSKPIKAYVVESDISAAQQTARQRNNESSF